MPWLKAKIFMHHETHTALCGLHHDRSRVGERGRKRLLADDVDAAASGFGADLAMAWGQGDDVDEVRFLAPQHFAPVEIKFERTEFLGNDTRFFPIAIAEGDEL